MVCEDFHYIYKQTIKFVFFIPHQMKLGQGVLAAPRMSGRPSMNEFQMAVHQL